MPNLAKIGLFFLLASSLCQVAVFVKTYKCYDTVKMDEIKKITRSNPYGDWKQMQEGFLEVVSVDEEIGEKLKYLNVLAEMDCLVLAYQINPKEGSAEKKFKVWKSWVYLDYCESEQRKKVEGWVKEAGGSNFKCWTCNHGDHCNNAGPKIECYDTTQGTGAHVLSGAQYVQYSAIKANFREVGSAAESVNIGDVKYCSAYSGCLMQFYQTGSKYMVWKSCAPTAPNYCESEQRNQIERKMKEKDGGHIFWCSTCDHSHKCNNNFPTTTTTTTTTTTPTTTTTTPTTTEEDIHRFNGTFAAINFGK